MCSVGGLGNWRKDGGKASICLFLRYNDIGLGNGFGQWPARAFLSVLFWALFGVRVALYILRVSGNTIREFPKLMSSSVSPSNWCPLPASHRPPQHHSGSQTSLSPGTSRLVETYNSIRKDTKHLTPSLNTPSRHPQGMCLLNQAPRSADLNPTTFTRYTD